MQQSLDDLRQCLDKKHPFTKHFPSLAQQVLKSWAKCEKHGDFKKWYQAYMQLPKYVADQCDFSRDWLKIGSAAQINTEQRQKLIHSMMSLYPWRKGPFDLFGIDLDCEWRSDMKWNRLKDHIAPLQDRLVLDVGCGSGYHCWRMLGAEAKLVIGIDPSLLFLLQFLAIKHFTGSQPVFVFPQTLDTFPTKTTAFDTVFSMGILYHRRSPMAHLSQLHDCLRKGGELVLETLVVKGDKQSCLVPEGRYACMANIWFLPSSAMLEVWLKRCGFKNIRVIHEADTNIQEQRPTPWTWNHSLQNFLDPQDMSKTLEGYPAPRRAVVSAIKI